MATAIEKLELELQKKTEALAIAEQKNIVSETAFNQLKSQFEQYKVDAQTILKESVSARIIKTEKDILQVGEDFFVFRIGAFSLNGKQLTAKQIIEAPEKYESEIADLIEKYKILKPYKD